MKFYSEKELDHFDYPKEGQLGSGLKKTRPLRVLRGSSVLKCFALFFLVFILLSCFPAFAIPTSSRVKRLVITLRWDYDANLDLQATFCFGFNRISSINSNNPSISGLGKIIADSKNLISMVATPPPGSTCHFHVAAPNTTRDEEAAINRSLNAELSVFENGRYLKTFFPPENNGWATWSVFSYSSGDIIEINKIFDKRFEKNPCSDPELVLIPGDILLGSIDESLVPGRWSHVGLYIGNGEVIEAFSADEPVSIRPTLEWISPEMKWVTYLRVISADSETRRKAIDFALSQFEKPYNKNIFFKRSKGDSYYCSELVWAAYINASRGKIDLDGPSFPLGVYPWEIEKSRHVTNIGGHYECPPKRSWKVALYAIRLIGREGFLFLSAELKARPLLVASIPLYITGILIVVSFMITPECAFMLRAGIRKKRIRRSGKCNRNPYGT